ncbi:hypothetical protein HPB50_027756 [Hyalomma asiaticum]|nr:hypothetical protein HPB50_027756 [Hyalomma asiaticum]
MAQQPPKAHRQIAQPRSRPLPPPSKSMPGTPPSETIERSFAPRPVGALGKRGLAAVAAFR